jgi:hypothetical protein
MRIKDYYTHLGLTYLSQQTGKNGIELIYRCPWCEGKSFSANANTGAWQCFAGCGKGYPYQFAVKLMPSLPKSDIFKTLEEFGIISSNPDTAVKPGPRPPTKPKLKKCQNLTRPELDQFCEVKGIDLKTFWTLKPARLTDKPIIIIPMHDPADSAKPCGYIRASINGDPVEIKYKEDNIWKSRYEKYPVVAGSNCGLVGLKGILDKDYDTIYFAEGWKDLLAARYFGFAAVTCGMGAGKWRESWAQVFKAKHVIIVGDADKGGVVGALKLAQNIQPHCKSVKNMVLPYTYREKSGLDLHDYLSENEDK